MRLINENKREIMTPKFYVETLINKGKNHDSRGATNITIVKILHLYVWVKPQDHYTFKRNTTLLIFPPHYNISHTLYFFSQIIFLCDASLFFLSFVILFGVLRMKNCPPFYREQIHYPPNVLQKKNNFFLLLSLPTLPNFEIDRKQFFLFHSLPTVPNCEIDTKLFKVWYMGMDPHDFSNVAGAPCLWVRFESHWHNSSISFE